MNYPSKYIEQAVAAFKKLPGIGEKTALRLVLHLLKQEKLKVHQFSEAISEMRDNIQYCNTCCNISDTPICSICANDSREDSIVCVVENIRDVIAIENTGTFNGRYHVLGGIISPINGVGPEELTINALLERVKEGQIKEIIMAISPTMEGDTTIYYISKLLKDYNITLSTISRGVSFGGELEYTDELTLSRSIAGRIPYENYFIK